MKIFFKVKIWFLKGDQIYKIIFIKRNLKREKGALEIAVQIEKVNGLV